MAKYSNQTRSSARFKTKLWTFLWLCTISCLIANVSSSETDCPWYGDDDLSPAIRSRCICARNPNSNNQLSVQCQDVDGPSIISILKSEEFPLELLYLNGSHVTDDQGHLPKGFLKGLKLISLQLSGCSIKSIHPAAFRGQEGHIKHLSLTGNLLSSVPTPALASLGSSLNLLDLSFNKITEIPGGSFETLDNLSTLKLNDNNLDSIDHHAFKNLENSLRNLNLKGTRLSTIPSAISNLTALAFLDLAQNRLRGLGHSPFSRLESLTALNLERNLLQTLPDLVFLGVNDTLSSLSLLNNLITHFPKKALQSLKELRVLDLGFNLLTEIPLDAFSGLKSLTLLALDGNPLASLPFPAFSSLNSTLRGLSLGGRFLSCDCRLQWIGHWIRQFDLQVTSRERSPQFCGAPSQFKDLNFYQIKIEDFVCEKNETISTTSTTTSTTTTTASSTSTIAPSSSSRSSKEKDYDIDPTSENLALLGHGANSKQFIPKPRPPNGLRKRLPGFHRLSSTGAPSKASKEAEDEDSDDPDEEEQTSENDANENKDEDDNKPPKFKFRPRPRPRLRPKFPSRLRNRPTKDKVVLEVDPVASSESSLMTTSEEEEEKPGGEDMDEIDNAPSNSSPVEKKYTEEPVKPSTFKPSTYRPSTRFPLTSTRRSPSSVKQFTSFRSTPRTPSVSPSPQGVLQAPLPKITSVTSTSTSITSSVSTSHEQRGVTGRANSFKRDPLKDERAGAPSSPTLYRTESRKPLTKVSFDTEDFDDSKIPVITGVGSSVRASNPAPPPLPPTGSANVIQVVKHINTSPSTTTSVASSTSTTLRTSTQQQESTVHQASTPSPSYNSRPPSLVFAEREKSDIFLKDIERTGDSVYLYWDSYKQYSGGFRIIYRFFGEENFRQGPPLASSEREYRIRNLPNDQCVVVCVVPYDDVLYSEGSTSEMPTGSQCKELKSSTPSVLMYNMDKITIGASAAICATVILAVVIFIAVTRRGKGKRNHSQMLTKVPPGLLQSLPQGSPPGMNGMISGGGGGGLKDWDTLSAISARSIPRARVYHGDNIVSNGGMNGHLPPGHLRNTLIPQRSVPDGHSTHRSYLSSHHAVHNHSFHHLGNGQMTRIDHRDGHSLSHTHLNGIGHPQSQAVSSYLNNQSRILRASMGSRGSKDALGPSQHSHRHFEQNQKKRKSQRVSQSDSMGTLSGYETPDNWADNDLDVYIARNHARHDLVQL